MSEAKRRQILDVAIEKVRAPGDLRARMARADVAEFAESIKRHGQLHPILVEKRTGQIISGRDRYSACHLAKIKTVLVEYVETESPIQAQQLEVIENLHRRHEPKNQRVLLKRLVELYAIEEANVQSVEELPRKRRGRPISIQGAALRRVAQDLGKNHDSLARELRRDAQQIAGTRKQQEDASASPTVETFGLEVDAGYLVQLRLIQSLLGRGQDEVDALRRRLSRLEAEGSPLIPTRLQTLFSKMNALKEELFRLRPVSICPACKLIETLTPDCPLCEGCGYVTQEQWERAPEELTHTEQLSVQVGESYVPYESMFEPASDEPAVETLKEVQARLQSEIEQDPASNIDLFKVEL